MKVESSIHISICLSKSIQPSNLSSVGKSNIQTFFTHPSILPNVNLSMYWWFIFVHPVVSPFIHLSIHPPSNHLLICPPSFSASTQSISFMIYLFIPSHPNICMPSIHPWFICPSIPLFFHPYICLSSICPRIPHTIIQPCACIHPSSHQSIILWPCQSVT